MSVLAEVVFSSVAEPVDPKFLLLSRNSVIYTFLTYLLFSLYVSVIDVMLNFAERPNIK